MLVIMKRKSLSNNSVITDILRRTEARRENIE